MAEPDHAIDTLNDLIQDATGRREDVTVGRYRHALDADPPPSSRRLVECPSRQVQHAHDRVRNLESHVDRER